VLQVADVRVARGVGQHLEHVALRRCLVEAGLAGVPDLPGPLLLPHTAPAGFDPVGLVAIHEADIRHCQTASAWGFPHPGGRLPTPPPFASGLHCRRGPRAPAWIARGNTPRTSETGGGFNAVQALDTV